MSDRYKKNTGDYGEVIAAKYLVDKGYEIIRKNYTKRGGEIDIIAKRKGLLVFVEVKTLPHGDDTTLQRELGFPKRRAISKTAKLFLLANRQYNDCLIRFDVIVIDMPGFPPIYHIKNAFDYCDDFAP